MPSEFYEVLLRFNPLIFGEVVSDSLLDLKGLTPVTLISVESIIVLSFFDSKAAISV